MKLKGNNIFDAQISKLALFRKGESKALSVSAKSVPSSQGISPGLGWNHAEVQAKRLMTFVKGIKVSGSGVFTGVANIANEFTINVDTFDYENLAFKLYHVCSDGVAAVDMQHDMTEMEDHVKIIYGVDKPGRYIMDIRYMGVKIPCSPFKIYIQQEDAANNTNAKDVVAFGKGLKRCMTDMKKSGPGQISIVADGNINVPICVDELKSGYKVQYVAGSTGTFFLRIKLNGRHITGSPFLITAENAKHPAIVSETGKHLFKRGFLAVAGGKEKKTDLQP